MQSPKMPITDLTFAAEIAGRIDDSEKVRPILLGLLQHPAPIVREGAIYGLAGHVDSSVISELKRLTATDLSRAVRTAAADLVAATP
jgi:HEAT repeat protein